jgi:hypothetical protein
MVIADETGALRIDPKAAQLDFKTSRRHANFLKSLPKDLEESLRERYKLVTRAAFLPKQMRYTEIVIPQEAEVFLLGDCQMKDGKAAFVTKEHPLLLSFRKEADLLRNGKIAARITAVAAFLVPMLFSLLAWYTYQSMSEKFKPRDRSVAVKNNAGKNNTNKEDLISQGIAKLKDPNASLSDRARAARKLPEAPAGGDLVAEVAPLLNHMLQSKDKFHRDSALMAIKQGWGNQANEEDLRRLLTSTKDAKTKKEVAAAIERLGK